MMRLIARSDRLPLRTRRSSTRGTPRGYSGGTAWWRPTHSPWVHTAWFEPPVSERESRQSRYLQHRTGISEIAR